MSRAKLKSILCEIIPHDKVDKMIQSVEFDSEDYIAFNDFINSFYLLVT